IFPAPAWILAPFVALFNESPLGGLFVVGLLAPVTEELFFRGFVLRGFLARYPAQLAIFASAVLFMVVHLNPWQSISALVAGLILGWLYLRTGSLLPCLLLHGLFNGLPILADLTLPPVPGFTGDPMAADQMQPIWF